MLWVAQHSRSCQRCSPLKFLRLGCDWQQYPADPKSQSYVEGWVIFTWVHCLHCYHQFLCHVTRHVLDPPQHLYLRHSDISILGCILWLLCFDTCARLWSVHWTSLSQATLRLLLFSELQSGFLCFRLCTVILCSSHLLPFYSSFL
jgi:hypothetical protein